MDKILAIASESLEYVSRLTEYLNDQDDFGFRTIGFTESSVLEAFASKNPIEILLCAQELLAQEKLERLGARKVILLSEHSFVNEDSEYPTIFKYQAARNIMKEILEYYTDRKAEGKAPQSGRKGAELTVVCAPAGGCFKSTFALALALHKSKKRRTLFVSFDPFFTLPSQKKDGAEQSLTDVVYFMEQSTKQLERKVKNVVRTIEELDFISGVAHWYDLYDFNVERMRLFLDTVIYNMDYECVVIDYASFDVTGMEVLLRSGKIYVPGVFKGRENDKYEEWLRQIHFVSGAEILDRVQRVKIPYDENLDKESFTTESLRKGVLGKFVEELCAGKES